VRRQRTLDRCQSCAPFHVSHFFVFEVWPPDRNKRTPSKSEPTASAAETKIRTGTSGKNWSFSSLPLRQANGYEAVRSTSLSRSGR